MLWCIGSTSREASKQHKALLSSPWNMHVNSGNRFSQNVAWTFERRVYSVANRDADTSLSDVRLKEPMFVLHNVQIDESLL